MAYQKGLPLLILKEEKIHKEGISDSNSSDYFVFDFDIMTEQQIFSKELEEFIYSWTKAIIK